MRPCLLFLKKFIAKIPIFGGLLWHEENISLKNPTYNSEFIEFFFVLLIYSFVWMEVVRSEKEDHMCVLEKGGEEIGIFFSSN